MLLSHLSPFTFAYVLRARHDVICCNSSARETVAGELVKFMRVQFMLPDLSCGSKLNELNHWPCQTLSSSQHAYHMSASHWKGRKGEILDMS